ncbi:solute carrier family 25 member 38 [Histoplasma capsulatum var. duboisii H88]|uniref:Mitochondrial glycine transporter n=2 Tax=Ajellomyces capsulatus (strain H88) TaxID=544711 RepID=A0A8A1LEI5_AJEC8|nr:solute carrier family 25 member 38 [Histoplasma capsulatum var. duboisii H88]
MLATADMSDGSTNGVRLKISTSSKPKFHFIAGLASGLSSAILLQPADLLKTRIQQAHQTSALLFTIRKILASPQPIRGLWRGTLPSALRTGFGSALYFSSLNALRQCVANQGPLVPLHGDRDDKRTRTSALPKLSHTANLLTGAMARTAAGFIMMPVTVIKVRYESDYYAYRSIGGAGRDIVRSEGFRGLFSGFGATAIRDAPYAGLYVVFYEQSKKNLNALNFGGLTTARPLSDEPARKDNSEKQLVTSSISVNFVSGALAAGLATSITNPFDVVKTRLQLMPNKYRNMAHAVRLMLREDGVRSLFGGLGLRMGRKAISSALAWTVYEELILKAEKRWPDQDNIEQLAP